ncbi:MAG: hypothetical protein ACOX5G_11890 [Kiritimatiellia bacterium]|jgi:hypothetical protein
MAEKKIDVEVTLESVQIAPKALKSPTGPRLFQCTFLWPRIGAAARAVSIPITLAKDGTWSAADHPWTETLLCKDSLQGRFGVVLGVTGRVPDSVAASFGRALASGAVRLMAGFADDAAGGGLLGDFFGLPFSAGAKTAAKDSPPAAVYGATGDFDAAALPAPGDTYCLELPLVANEAVEKNAARSGPRKSSSVTARRVLAKKGETVGRCVLALKVL